VRSAARDGVLALDEPLPEGPTPAALLGHRSGLAGDLYEVPLDAPSDEAAAAALLDRFLPLVPRVAPGRFWYSNLGYVLAGLALARAEGEPLLAVVRRRVLGPAGAEVEVPSPAGVALRAAGSGIRLRALDRARAGVALGRGPVQPPGGLRARRRRGGDGSGAGRRPAAPGADRGRARLVRERLRGGGRGAAG
jgi:CubicO group peptidase (beta-lactamase class C family)